MFSPQGCKPKCVETGIGAALKESGSQFAANQLPTLSQLRTSLRTLADGCVALSRGAIEQVQQVLHLSPVAYAAPVQDIPLSSPHTEDVQAA